VINTNLHLISYRFEVIADYCSNMAHTKRSLHVTEPFSGLWGNVYAVHLRLIGKLVIDFPFVLIELFSLGVIRLRRYEQILIGNHVEGTSPTNNFRTDREADECLTTLSLTAFTQRNLIADFLREKCNFRRKTAVLCLEPHLGEGVEAAYDVHLRLTGKRVMDYIRVN